MMARTIGAGRRARRGGLLAACAIAVASFIGVGVRPGAAQTPPVAAERPAAFPVPIRYTLDRAGQVAIAIDDARGVRVRNLLAEAPREDGERVEGWDGRDDAGKAVPPGEYTFKGAVTPKLALSYEFTVNNSGDPPWWKQDVWEPRPEPGGWMSDHVPTIAAAAVGDKVFLGADTAEHGHSIIAVDLTGRKLWGAKWLELAGARCVCSDGKTVFTAGEGAWIGERMRLFAIDPASFAVRKVADVDLAAGPYAKRGGLSGLAARDGLVYASFNPPRVDAAASPLDAAALDLANTTAGGIQAKHVNALLRVRDSDQPWVNWPLPEGKPPVIRIAWTAPQSIGTILSPQRLEIAALRADAAYPGDVSDDKQWATFEADTGAAAMKVYAAPPDTRTRALRVRVIGAATPIKLDQPQAPAVEAESAPESFVGMRVLGTGFVRVKGDAKVSASAGQMLGGGAWENRQDADITSAAPATYTLEFASPASVSALAIRDPFFAKARVEVRETVGGPWAAAGEVSVTFGWRRAYGDVVADLGRERTVSAIRICVTEPAVDQNSEIKTRTGLTRHVCGLGGVVALGGGDAPGPGQRVTVFDAKDGRVVRDVPLRSPGALAFDRAGRLLAVSGDRVVSVALDGGAATPVIANGLREPGGIACDAGGTIYVSDGGDQVVKRFTAEGKPAGVVGKAGGLDVGPYDPEHMSHPRGICVDARGRLWVAEEEMRPKKVSVWDVTGGAAKLERYFVGGPRYGCGFMYIDPQDAGRFFFEGLEFAVDWKAGTSAVKNVLWREGRGGTWPGVTCDRPVYVGERLYLLGEPFWFYGNRYVAIAKYAGDRAVPVAAAGKADEWPPLREAKLRAAVGNPDLGSCSFLWSDLNDDGLVQADEVKIGPKGLRLEEAYFGARIGDDLTIQFPGGRFAPVRFTKGGAPVYDFEHMTPPPKLTPGGFGLYNTAMTADGGMIEVSDRIAVHDRDGALRWSYPDRFNGVHGSMKAPPPQPGMLIGTLHVIGTARLKELGEVFAVSTNKGEVELFTADGLWVARLFKDNRYGRGFNLPKATRGMPLDEISLNAEHFGGTFNQLGDGRIFLVAGHNHNSVIRLDGLDGARRFGGAVSVSAEQAKLAAARPAAAAVAKREPERWVVPRSPGGVAIDGDLADWADVKPVALKGTGAHAADVRLMYDPGALLVAADVRGVAGMVNHEKDWKMLFRAGDCVDLHLRTKPGGAGDAVAGDLRVVLSRHEDKAVAVVYRPVVKGTDPAKRTRFASPVTSVTFDVVERLDVAVTVTDRADGYTLEAAIPWADLGVKPEAGMKLSGDVGVLFADRAGLATVERVYWSNRDAGLVSDVPGEARLQPGQWGPIELK